MAAFVASRAGTSQQVMAINTTSDGPGLESVRLDFEVWKSI